MLALRAKRSLDPKVSGNVHNRPYIPVRWSQQLSRVPSSVIMQCITYRRSTVEPYSLAMIFFAPWDICSAGRATLFLIRATATCANFSSLHHQNVTSKPQTRAALN